MCSKTDCGRAAALPALLTELHQQLVAFPQVRRWVVALSGGLDSSLLLELLARLSLPQAVVALHIDHQLQAPSRYWAEHCRQQCQRLDIDFHLHRVTPESDAEASARAARYAVFEAELQPGDCLLLAHHADDQAETLLLRLLRGAGVAGMGGIPLSRPLGRGMLLRPMLKQSRARLEQVASEIGLEHVEDPSNQSPAYDRNYLRLELLPGLQKRWPSLLVRSSETAELMAEARELLDERAEEDFLACAVQRGLKLDCVQQLSRVRRRNLLHHWISGATGHRPTRTQLLQLEHDVLAAREDAQPVFRLSDMQLRRHRGVLHLLPDPLPVIPADPLAVVVGHNMDLPLGTLEWQPAHSGLQSGRSLDVCFRQGGERVRPVGRGGSVGLKQLLQEAGMPPWLRSYQPLLVDAGEILAVPGVALSEAGATESGLLPIWSGFGLS